MIDGKYVILTIPKTGKSVVLRTVDEEDECTLSIAGLNLNAALVTVNDSFDEACQVVSNLSK